MYGMIITPADSFNRPADTDAYGDGDLVANDTDAGDVVPLAFSVARLGSGRGKIRAARLFKDDETVTAADFILHLFTASPTVSNGDNGSFAVTTAENHLASIDCDMTSGAFASSTDVKERFTFDPPVMFDLGNERALYGLIEADGAYNPASGEEFTVTLEIEG